MGEIEFTVTVGEFVSFEVEFKQLPDGFRYLAVTGHALSKAVV